MASNNAIRDAILRAHYTGSSGVLDDVQYMRSADINGEGDYVIISPDVLSNGQDYWRAAYVVLAGGRIVYADNMAYGKVPRLLEFYIPTEVVL